jgi:hypothetical protein
MDENSLICLMSRFREMGYDVKGAVHRSEVPEKNISEKNIIYVDGHHPELRAYGYIRLTEGIWQNLETEITIFPPLFPPLPPEVFLG